MRRLTLLQAELLEEELLVVVRLQLGDVLLGLGSDDHHLGSLFLCELPYLACPLVAVAGVLLGDVAHVEHGL